MYTAVMAATLSDTQESSAYACQSKLWIVQATSALDAESEALVQEALERVAADRTVVVIAHRLSTVANADEVAVVDYGVIAERGTHAQLLERGACCCDLCNSPGWTWSNVYVYVSSWHLQMCWSALLFCIALNAEGNRLFSSSKSPRHAMCHWENCGDIEVPNLSGHLMKSFSTHEHLH